MVNDRDRGQMRGLIYMKEVEGKFPPGFSFCRGKFSATKLEEKHHESPKTFSPAKKCSENFRLETFLPELLTFPDTFHEKASQKI